jgi:hypothetical protein
MQEQPALHHLYEKYKGAHYKKANRFEIYGVSLDNKKDSWIQAINKMHITWIQASDLKFWNSKAARIYGVEELPFNVLIDENGIVLAKNLHGAALEKAIQKLISQ